MSRAWLGSVALCCFVAASACDDGGVESFDSGVRVNRDAAPSIEASARDATEDAQTESGPVESGAPLDAGVDGACTVAGPIEPFGVSCAAATFDCLGGCMDGSCQMACIEADPEPEVCLNCVLGNLTSCAQERGCQDEWDGYYCCVEAAGCFALTGDEARTCATTSCTEAFTRYQDCANPLQAECFPVQRMCFPP
ncbi:MAG: hypothetical protein IT379_02220 [Deltaproteobacteria bacterium]|nr:hypothetical protein [Deltaproteobacteria bacterium]